MLMLLRLLRYCLEGFLVYLGLAVFSASPMPAIFPFLVAFLLPAFVLWGLSRKLKTIRFVVLILLVFGFTAIDWVLGDSPFLSLILAIVCTWRSFSYLFQYAELTDGPNEMYLFFAGLVVSIVLYMFFQYHSVLYVSIFQLLYLLAMNVFRRLAESTESFTEKGRIYRWGGGAFAAILVVPALFLLLFSAAKWVFFNGFSIIGRGLGFIIGYPIYMIIHWLSHGKKVDVSRLLGSSHMKKHPKQHIPLHAHHSGFNEWFWILALIVLILLVVVMFSILKKKIQMNRIAGMSLEAASSRVSGTSMRKSSKRRAKPPKDAVRRMFYQLQKKLAASGMGRSRSESVSDWFGRLELGSDEKALVAARYRQVRYGEEPISDEERVRYEQAVKALMREAKEKKKDDPGTG